MNIVFSKAKSAFSDLTCIVMDATKSFRASDYAVIKLTLVSLGILLGASFASSFRKSKPFLALTFLCGYQYLIARVLLIYKRAQVKK